MSEFTCKYRNSGASGNDPQECAWPQCGCYQRANRVIDHIEECGFVIDDELLLERVRTVLWNMAEENELPWWNFWTSRWPISHEPLRSDARSLLPLIDKELRG